MPHPMTTHPKTLLSRVLLVALWDPGTIHVLGRGPGSPALTPSGHTSATCSGWTVLGMGPDTLIVGSES